MPTGNFDSQGITPPSRPSAKRAFRLPADYYSAPASELRRLFPPWVAFGCGTTAAVVLVVLFAGGALLNGPAIGQGVDVVIGITLGELRPMLARDVTGEQKDAFEREVKLLRAGLRSNRVPLARVQTFLQSVQNAVEDKTVTPAEMDRLIAAAREASAGGPKQ